MSALIAAGIEKAAQIVLGSLEAKGLDITSIEVHFRSEVFECAKQHWTLRRLRFFIATSVIVLLTVNVSTKSGSTLSAAVFLYTAS